MHFIYLCVENPLFKINKVVITEKEVEVFEGLCEEERLLNIILVSLNLKIYQSDETILFNLLEKQQVTYRRVIHTPRRDLNKKVIKIHAHSQ